MTNNWVNKQRIAQRRAPSTERPRMGVNKKDVK